MTDLTTAYNPPAKHPELSERDCILNLLEGFMNQRSGLEFVNCGDATAFRAEQRSITKDLHHARELLRAVRWRESIGAAELRQAFRAFSGRLSYDPAKRSLDYCTGQYFPTEYRRAVCAVLASALWEYTRANMPEPVYKHHGSATDLPMSTESLYDGMSAGDWIRAKLKKEFGAAIAKRWFN